MSETVSPRRPAGARWETCYLRLLGDPELKGEPSSAGRGPVRGWREGGWTGTSRDHFGASENGIEALPRGRQG